MNKELKALKKRIEALEASAHTEHTLTGISNELLEQIANVTVNKVVAKIIELVPAETKPEQAIEEQKA